MIRKFGLFIGFLCVLSEGIAQKRAINYEEKQVVEFALPDLLTTVSGKKITTVRQWERQRRPELLTLFSEQMYGITPKEKVKVSYRLLEEHRQALRGKATRRQVELSFIRNGVERKAILLIYLPNDVKGKAPLFFAYNFWGNQAIQPDSVIIPTSEYERGSRISRWPVDRILAAGYGVATIDYNAIFPDRPDGHGQSILALFGIGKPTRQMDDRCQAIGAWAWGMSRAMDYFEKDKRIDASRVVLFGHSRQGKAALWAGAQDKRFAAVVSSCSGCGGAALSKRVFGETIAAMTDRFPHWFCRNFDRYGDRESELPFDQHKLIALIAPRPVYVASAEDDLWADPKGEYLSAFYAGAVYRLYGMKGLETACPPEINEPVMNRVGYHIRSGIHDVTEDDWKNYLRFADRWIK